MLGGLSHRTHGPLGCRHDKRPGGIPVILSIAFLGEGELYLRGEPTLRQEWPKGDSQREEAMYGNSHCLLMLPTSSVRSAATNG